MKYDKYWLYIAAVRGLESGRRRLLLEMLGSPEDIYLASEKQLRSIPLLEDFHIDQLLELRKHDFSADAERFEEQGLHFITADEEGFPEKLKNIPDAPLFLFYYGELPANCSPSVAIVGSRKCSIYGQEVCLMFAKRLAECGIDIVSGMAMGVDGFAHRGAIAGGGKTYGILGCGADICYPSSNSDIYDAMKKRGGIISEYYPGTQPLPLNFPQRNRIISGLSDVLLVVEARKKSGTSITVGQALEQGREVFAIPGRVGDTISDGCNLLIKNGAHLAGCPEDIIEELKEKYELLLLAEKKRKKQVAAELSRQERTIIKKLSFTPVAMDELSAMTGISEKILPGLLVEMELKDLVKEVGKNVYVRKKE
ncbi:MAG: DNA-processing protein DprA [Lachnospiraceae bacterium]|nr:DNA-processing protein DprA [Lachnospiraceae bacterium]